MVLDSDNLREIASDIVCDSACACAEISPIQKLSCDSGTVAWIQKLRLARGF